MGFKNNSKEKVDKNFALAVNILNKNKIKYWICHGTLLGIIRDNQLIPWDHDIDIAVWSSNNLKNKIKKIMLSKKFTLKEKYLIEDDLLTFIKPGGREVDINFYKIDRQKNIAFVKWYIPKNYLMRVIEILSFAKNYKGKYYRIINMLSFTEKFFLKIKKIFVKKGIFYSHAGYSHKIDYAMKLKKHNFSGLNVLIPNNFEEYLEDIYGVNWRTPIKKYSWVKDSPSTIKF